MLQTEVGDENTANTLSHYVATLQTRLGDEDSAGSLSHNVSTQQTKEEDADTAGTLSHKVALLDSDIEKRFVRVAGNIDMGYNTIW